MTATEHLIMACVAMAFLTFAVGIRLFIHRIGEMKRQHIHPQAVATSAQRAERLTDSRASDNYNHLFELPVLFYLLCILAIITNQIPGWLTLCAWVFVVLRVIHSVIQCTYNKVVHRFMAFLAGFLLLFGMWLGFALQFIGS
ncbi:MAPEG family protein [Aliiglaciecola sp. CAU 1673]|uniref:MAPEG family protein n=1 Tax=Aliiglaciecola sp. CAU 1673 TaxID=3032595 RepID=UPI0023DC0870|nr:MAPEG family protein [Aliiglaciecola sp. CAU 1673]MDF2178796.1 MAPEG family protein [Aliiglaciecola sp. CAU 1673]